MIKFNSVFSKNHISLLVLNHMSQIKCIALVCTLFINGCGTVNPEFTSHVKPSDYIFSESSYKIAEKNFQIEKDALIKLGSDKSGYIKPDNSSTRIDFERKYPIIPPNETDYETLTEFRYNWKLGQVLSLSADLDVRTSGLLKDQLGRLISVSGMINPSPNISDVSLQAGANSAIGAAISPNLAINPTASVGTNAALGLGAGLVAGIIIAIQAETAFKGLLSAQNFGERMEASSTAIPQKAFRIDRFALMGFPAQKDYIRIAPGVVRVFFGVIGERTLKYENLIVLISATGTYRGPDYKQTYPSTEGWEFSVTNLNFITVREGSEGLERFNTIREELNKNKIEL